VKVAVVPIDSHGVGSYRALWPAAVAKAAGVDVTVVRRSTSPRRMLDNDVVVVQVPLTAAQLTGMVWLQEQGVRVVVEVDDDYSRIHPRNLARTAVDWEDDPGRAHEYLAIACQRADWVTVSTERLAQVYGSHGRVSVVPNCVPARYLDAVHHQVAPGPLVGWSGVVRNHPTDLQAMGDAVRRLPDDVVLGIIGPDDGASKIIDEHRLAVKTGWLDLDDYPAYLACFDVGVVPLARSLFNEAKSWLKGLEYSAVGVPFVATPTGPYRQLHRAVGGWLADSPADWHHKLLELVTQPGLRAELAGRARLAAAAWTIEGNVHRWVEAWAAAIHHQAHTPPVMFTLSGSSAAHAR
jgi:glycosyltransferase involved in cell wall biosynthesis